MLFLRHIIGARLKTVMIGHSIKHFCSPFSLGSGGGQVTQIDCQTNLNIEFVDRDFEKYSFKFGAFNLHKPSR